MRISYKILFWILFYFAKKDTHISLFLIDKEIQGIGLGKKLFNLMLEENNLHAITVNSSIYATDVYKKSGFKTTGYSQWTPFRTYANEQR